MGLAYHRESAISGAVTIRAAKTKAATMALQKVATAIRAVQALEKAELRTAVPQRAVQETRVQIPTRHSSRPWFQRQRRRRLRR
ncbi:MAG: hypothetical protein K1W31_12005 [Lachnospiraceae bacterium]